MKNRGGVLVELLLCLPLLLLLTGGILKNLREIAATHLANFQTAKFALNYLHKKTGAPRIEIRKYHDSSEFIYREKNWSRSVRLAE